MKWENFEKLMEIFFGCIIGMMSSILVVAFFDIDIALLLGTILLISLWALVLYFTLDTFIFSEFKIIKKDTLKELKLSKEELEKLREELHS